MLSLAPIFLLFIRAIFLSFVLLVLVWATHLEKLSLSQWSSICPIWPFLKFLRNLIQFFLCFGASLTLTLDCVPRLFQKSACQNCVENIFLNYLHDFFFSFLESCSFPTINSCTINWEEEYESILILTHSWYPFSTKKTNFLLFHYAYVINPP